MLHLLVLNPADEQNGKVMFSASVFIFFCFFFGGYFDPEQIFKRIKTNNFLDYLNDILAKKEALVMLST